jgi:N-acetylneuraminic acid mutarotase
MIISTSEISGALLDGHFYTAGGYTSGGMPPVFVNTAQVYNIEKNEWQQIAVLPQQRHHNNMIAHDGKVYSFGGAAFSPTGRRVFKAWVYDPDIGDWESITSMPSTRMAAATVAWDEYIYILGGLLYQSEHDTPGADNEVLRYHPASNEWTILSAPEETREHPAAVLLNGKIYLIGGRYGNDMFASVEIYDPANDTWAPGTPMNEPRSAHVALVIDNKIWVFGGEVLFPELKILNSVEIYDPESDTWTSGPEMPYSLHGYTGFVYNGVIYLVGGSEVPAAVENHGRVLAIMP